MNSRKNRGSDEIEITIPPEDRWENRIEHEHTRSQWVILQQRYNNRCAYCGIRKEDTPEKYLTRDHLVPVLYFGTDKIENIVPACKRCNFMKGTGSPGHRCRDGDALIPQPKPRKRLWRWWL